MSDVSILIGDFARHGKRKRRAEGQSVWIILSMQLAVVGFYDSPHAIQTKAIMPLTNFPNRFAPPILRRQIKTILRFMKSEQEPVVVDFGFRQKWAFATIM